MSEELYHYGTKGQRWGQRKYQNSDGTWTELGKARRRKGNGRGASKKRIGAYEQTMFEGFDDADGDGDVDWDDVGRWSEESGNRILRAHQLLTPKKEKGQNIDYGKYREEMDKMSDDELRKITNRMNLENQYVKLNSERSASKGKIIAMNVLKGVGTAISLGASAMVLYNNGQKALGPIFKKIH